MRIIGVDPGLTRCGFGIINKTDARKILIEHVQVSKTSTKFSLSQRIHQLGEEFDRLIKKHKPDLLAIEKVFAQQNLSSVMGVANLSGAFIYLAMENNISVKVYSPTQVKAAVTGYGAADKQQVAAMVQRILRLETLPKPVDATDSLAIAICAAWNAVDIESGRISTLADINSTQLTQLTPAQQAWHDAINRKNKI